MLFTIQELRYYLGLLDELEGEEVYQLKNKQYTKKQKKDLIAFDGHVKMCYGPDSGIVDIDKIKPVIKIKRKKMKAAEGHFVNIWLKDGRKLEYVYVLAFLKRKINVLILKDYKYPIPQSNIEFIEIITKKRRRIQKIETPNGVMYKVSSSRIDSIGYDAEKKTLYIKFLVGITCAYYDVPEVHFIALLSVKSVELYFNKFITNGHYLYEKIFDEEEPCRADVFE